MNDKVDIKVFDPAHLDLADIRDHEVGGILAVPGARENLKYLTRTGDAMTMMVDGKIIAFAGYFPLWTGVCEVWIIPTVHVKEYVTQFARTMKHYLDTTMKAAGFHRAQTTALDDDAHNRWLGWVGFKEEGTLKQYSTKKQDYKMWAKFYTEDTHGS